MRTVKITGTFHPISETRATETTPQMVGIRHTEQQAIFNHMLDAEAETSSEITLSKFLCFLSRAAQAALDLSTSSMRSSTSFWSRCFVFSREAHLAFTASTCSSASCKRWASFFLKSQAFKESGKTITSLASPWEITWFSSLVARTPFQIDKLYGKVQSGEQLDSSLWYAIEFLETAVNAPCILLYK